ncbi:hypothetical protein ABIC08_006889 [Bradyrhizobium sp. RT9b]|uniref:hypothetical protein n=1 Tax=unclassified Bradyrhizobium TaxID=2631580 RepID=UPI00339908FE
MPALSKANYETVAQALAAGKTQREAYQAGGYIYKAGNAHRLCKSPSITARVDEIVIQRYEDERKSREIAARKAGLDESWIIERVKYVAEIALRGSPRKAPNGEVTYGQPNLNAAVRALRLCCDIKGMLLHRLAVNQPNEFAHMSDDDLVASLAATVRAMGLPEPAVQQLLCLRGPSKTMR